MPTDNLTFTVDAKADAKGRVTIPKDVRAALGAARGGKVTFIVENGEIRVVNAALRALSELQARLGAAAKTAAFPDEESVADWAIARRKGETP